VARRLRHISSRKRSEFDLRVYRVGPKDPTFAVSPVSIYTVSTPMKKTFVEPVLREEATLADVTLAVQVVSQGRQP
jgi:hypothetical protein